MPRPAKFSKARILSAAANLVAGGGPGAATIVAIAQATGAPSGSIYHRFGSRDELLGRLWLTKAAYFQDAFAAAFAAPDARRAATEGALSLPRAARADLEGARIMLLHRREDFLGAGWPAEMNREAERLGGQIAALLREGAMRLFGKDTKANRERTTFALVDIPLGAVRRHVAQGKPPPAEVDALIELAVGAVLDARTNDQTGKLTHDP